MARWSAVLAFIGFLPALQGCGADGGSGKPAPSATDAGDQGGRDGGAADLAEGEGEGEGQGQGEGEGEGEGSLDGGFPEEEVGVDPACNPLDEPAGPQVTVRFEPDGHFFARPFPDDSRKDADGHLVLAGFPNPGSASLLDLLLTQLQTEAAGWAANGTIYVSFSGKLHPAFLPPDAAATMEPSATVFLAEVGADGRFGQRIPLMLHYQDEESLFLPANTLSAYPVPGFVPRGGVQHALVVTTGLRDRACRPVASARGELRARLARGGLALSGVAGAAVFTPQDVIEPMRRLKQAVDGLPLPRAQGLRRQPLRAQQYEYYEGTVNVPNFQAGDPPYLTPGSGGNIVWDERGRPVVQRWEAVRICLTIPRNLERPHDGWPLVIYSHGTGGDFESVLDGTAAELGSRGIAALGFDQVLHGPRDPSGSSPELTFFNVMNMVAGRDNMLQGGVDGLVMLRLAQGLAVPIRETPDGQPAFIDPDKVMFLGHSQGGLTGSPFLAVAEGIRAAVFSGTAGLLRITVLQRANMEFDLLPGVNSYKQLVERILGIEGREELDMFHPVLTLLQTFAEPADTLGYAPYFHLRRKPGQTRIPILTLEGFLDPYSPAEGGEAFAVAAGADLIAPVGRPVPGLELLGREPLDPPVSGNWDGVTAGLSQYPEDGHFAIYYNPAARERAYGFLVSALGNGQPVIQ